MYNHHNIIYTPPISRMCIACESKKTYHKIYFHHERQEKMIKAESTATADWPQIIPIAMRLWQKNIETEPQKKQKRDIKNKLSSFIPQMK